jgi:RNA polymerase sigma-70 factor (ECF subfamily)
VTVLLRRIRAASPSAGADAGLAAIDAIPRESIATYQPYWALRAHVLKRLGRDAEAAQAFERAIGLSEDRAVREFLVGPLRRPRADGRARRGR